MSESQNIMPEDLVTVIFLPDAYYAGAVKPGAFGTAMCRIESPDRWDPQGKYWSVFFPGTGAENVNERVLRKIDGEGRNVGRWDYCVFNAPKYAKEQRREAIERLRG